MINNKCWLLEIAFSPIFAILVEKMLLVKICHKRLLAGQKYKKIWMGA